MLKTTRNFMNVTCRLNLAVVLSLCLLKIAATAEPDVRFERQVLNDKYFCDGVGAGDINGDGQIDIVA